MSTDTILPVISQTIPHIQNGDIKLQTKMKKYEEKHKILKSQIEKQKVEITTLENKIKNQKSMLRKRQKEIKENKREMNKTTKYYKTKWEQEIRRNAEFKKISNEKEQDLLATIHKMNTNIKLLKQNEMNLSIQIKHLRKENEQALHKNSEYFHQQKLVIEDYKKRLEEEIKTNAILKQILKKKDQDSLATTNDFQIQMKTFKENEKNLMKQIKDLKKEKERNRYETQKLCQLHRMQQQRIKKQRRELRILQKTNNKKTE